MTISVTRDFLFWCAVLNYGMLMLWILLYFTVLPSVQPLMTKWYRISAEQNEIIQFTGIVYYKVAIWMFFIMPYFALRIMG